MERTWTIAELAEQAATALSAEASGQRINGRVRDLPNERLIRWYTTIGLVDPPLGRRGRTALYGPRHLLQLVAVKRRQATGRSIAEIQAELAGATDATLGEIARLPGSPALDPRPEPAWSPGSGPERGRAHFWTAQPSLRSEPSMHPEPPSEVDGAQAGPALVQGVRIVPGVTILLDALATSGLTVDDLAAIETAARPLLDELRRRGLLDDSAPSGQTPPDSGPSESAPPDTGRADSDPSDSDPSGRAPSGPSAPRVDVRTAEPPGRSQ